MGIKEENQQQRGSGLASSVCSPLAAEIKNAVSTVLQDALRGVAEYRTEDGFIRWGRVESDIHGNIEQIVDGEGISRESLMFDHRAWKNWDGERLEAVDRLNSMLKKHGVKINVAWDWPNDYTEISIQSSHAGLVDFVRMVHESVTGGGKLVTFSDSDIEEMQRLLFSENDQGQL